MRHSNRSGSGRGRLTLGLLPLFQTCIAGKSLRQRNQLLCVHKTRSSKLSVSSAHLFSKVQPHTHPTAERLTVISGTSRIGMGDKFDEAATQEMSAGSYVVLPPGMTHFVSLTSDSIVQIDNEGPFQINCVNPADDPRNAKK